MAEIILDKISKRFSNGFYGVKELSLTIADGEFIVLVGPSGCGKTTALRMVAGLETISSGDVLVDGKRVNDVLEKDRDMAMVFQNYALYPHMTVAQNIGFNLKLNGVPRDEMKRRVRQTAEMLGLESLMDRRPKQLSGGQRQRVAMGRAIIRDPRAFLMDEPLSNLDAKLRVQMRSDISELQKRLGTTTLYVTHDQIEAMTMGDRVAVLKAGELQQVGTPHEIYDQPANLFVAGFVGSPPMNLVEGRLVTGDGGAVGVAIGPITIPLSAHQVAQQSLSSRSDGELIVGIRPEDLIQAPSSPPGPDEARHRAVVNRVEAVGASLLVYFALDVTAVHRESLADTGHVADERLVVVANGTTICATFPPRSMVRPGDEVEVSVLGERLHLFDPVTELNLA
ncbi:MAG: sn-glycerol-3-phosphate ABC transporter ATP-binding protein UgpC [Actinomycetota bacterium]|nr:sn-glycerol-3-phosphate ABC transporter ATP-binding protein UgpC [Actinomycetota bacterium]